MGEDSALVLEIMYLRAYAQAKAALDSAEDETKLPPSAIVDAVVEIRDELMVEAMERRRGPLAATL